MPSHIGIIMNTEADALADAMHINCEAQLLNVQPSVSIRMIAATSRLRALRICKNTMQEKHQFTRYLRLNPLLKQPRPQTKRSLEILIQNMRLSYLDSCLFHHRNVTCNRCDEPFNVSHYLVDCSETDDLSEAVMEIVGGGNMTVDEAAEKFLHCASVLDPEYIKEMGSKFNHV